MQFDRSKLTDTGFVPNGMYTVFVVGVKQEPSGKGTEQDIFDLQIIAPDQKKFGDKVFQTAGVQFDARLFYTDNTMSRTLEVLRKLGIKSADTADDTKVIQEETKKLENHSFDVFCGSKDFFATEQLTPEDIAKGVKPWDKEPIRDEKGNPIKLGTRVDIQWNTVLAGTVRPAVRPTPY